MWKTILNSDLVPLYDFPSTVVEDDIYGEFPTNPLLSLDEKQQEVSFSITPKYSVWGGVASGTDIHNVSESTFDFDLDSLEQRQNVAREKAKQLHQEQLQAGNLWFSRSFPLQSLAEVVRHRTDLVDKWISVISDQNPSSSQILWRLRSFYESLCVILLEVNPTLGVQLYWQLLDKDSSIRFVDEKTQLTTLDLALFNSPQTDEVQKAWDKKLSMCQSDHELMQIALLAQHGKANKWLWTCIDRDIESPILFKQARAIKLLGFMSEEQAKISLQSKLTSFLSDTWLYRMTEQSLLFWQKNKWASYWFNEFLSSSSQVHSWTSFRLFLRCVDSRFWLWKDKLIYSDSDHPEELIQFLNGNSEEINRWIKKNEKDLHKQFLGQKIQKNQVWPWMQAYLS